MAKLVQEQLVINIARMFKDDDSVEDAISDEMLEQIEAVIQELVGNNQALIEIQKLRE